MRFALAEAQRMAKRLFSPPGYQGYGDAKRYLSSDQCKDWLAHLSEDRRKSALEDLKEEIRLDALQAKRDSLVCFVATEVIFFAWYEYECPEEEMEGQIALLSAAKESIEAESDTIAMRKLAANRAQNAGYQDFKKSGLSPNAYSLLRKAEYFHKPLTGEPLGPRQIVRIIKAHQKAESRVSRSL